MACVTTTQRQSSRWKSKGLSRQLTRRTDAPQIEIYLRITRLMLVNSYLPIFVRVEPRGPEACARKRWLDQSAAKGRLRMLVFPFARQSPYFSHVIVGQNAYGSVGAIVRACFALISIKIAALFYWSLYCPRVVVKQRPPVFNGGRCASEQPPNQSINECKLGFILQNNGHLDWCRHATRSLCAY